VVSQTPREVCGYKNQHGISCGLSKGHKFDHEPCEQLVEPDPFCLRATDPFTLSAIRVWITAARAMKVPEAKLQRAEQHFHDIKRWQQLHGTKLPG
jgi:hypothetical protein